MKKAILIVGVIALVLLSGCAEITGQGKLKAEEAEELAYLDPDRAVGVCGEIEDAYSRNRCYLDIVQIIAKFDTTKAEEICDRTESVYLIDRTKDKCYFAVASNLDPNYPSEAERICGKISIFSSKQADACPVMAGSLYGDITDEEAIRIEEYAVSVADEDWVTAFQACEVKGVFRNRCLSRAAVAGRDTYLCSFIEDDSEYSIDGCARSVAPLCTSIQDVTARDECYGAAQAWQSTADMSLCEKIESQGIKDACYWNATQKETVSPEIPEEKMIAGETFTISLDCNPSTGYTWEITKIDSNLVELAGQDFQSGCAEPMPGCGGTCVFTFEALKEGSTEIEMVYCHSWECEETTFETKRITVSIS